MRTSFFEPAKAPTSFWISGSSMRQGPHQVAQKSIKTTFPASSALVIVLVLPGPSRTVSVKSGAGLPSFVADRGLLFLAAALAGERVDLGKAVGRLERERSVAGDLS